MPNICTPGSRTCPEPSLALTKTATSHAGAKKISKDIFVTLVSTETPAGLIPSLTPSRDMEAALDSTRPRSIGNRLRSRFAHGRSSIRQNPSAARDAPGRGLKQISFLCSPHRGR